MRAIARSFPPFSIGTQTSVYAGGTPSALRSSSVAALNPVRMMSIFYLFLRKTSPAVRGTRPSKATDKVLARGGRGARGECVSRLACRDCTRSRDLGHRPSLGTIPIQRIKFSCGTKKVLGGKPCLGHFRPIGRSRPGRFCPTSFVSRYDVPSDVDTPGM